MVLSLRVSELQVLLGFAGQSKFGKKNELQARAVNLIRRNSVPIKMKIMELYDSIHCGQGLLVTSQQAIPQAKKAVVFSLWSTLRKSTSSNQLSPIVTHHFYAVISSQN
ncbi:hypothetical protein PR048_010058 [Dryococelus australis]|uniref:SAP domain-containing protein n=1 Tax=Dryococelus australis TaxID=614101 RepID=A0ABQ9I1M8_9NEOP|nr:hypothetical protein PR048_010058 [Dryococelus australis]